MAGIGRIPSTSLTQKQLLRRLIGDTVSKTPFISTRTRSGSPNQGAICAMCLSDGGIAPGTNTNLVIDLQKLRPAEPAHYGSIPVGIVNSDRQWLSGVSLSHCLSHHLPLGKFLLEIPGMEPGTSSMPGRCPATELWLLSGVLKTQAEFSAGSAKAPAQLVDEMVPCKANGAMECKAINLLCYFFLIGN